jgi:hypothetical protein
MVVVAASKGRQLSNEVASGGLFTTELAAAITSKRKAADVDGNGVIDLGELYRAVKVPVANQAHQFTVRYNNAKYEQTPWLARNALVGEMTLF